MRTKTYDGRFDPDGLQTDDGEQLDTPEQAAAGSGGPTQTSRSEPIRSWPIF